MSGPNFIPLIPYLFTLFRIELNDFFFEKHKKAIRSLSPLIDCVILITYFFFVIFIINVVIVIIVVIIIIFIFIFIFIVVIAIIISIEW